MKIRFSNCWFLIKINRNDVAGRFPPGAVRILLLILITVAGSAAGAHVPEARGADGLEAGCHVLSVCGFNPGTADTVGKGSNSNSAGTLIEAVTGGKVDLEIRPRSEFVKAEGLRPATAVTNRLLLGYGSRTFHGFSGYAGFIHVHAFTPSGYNAAGLNNQPDRSVVADPALVILNQLYGDYRPGFGEIHIRAGRQRIILDDARFVGNVGWRQNEQTYDAITAVSSLGLEQLNLHYSMVWRVNRIFGPGHPVGVFNSAVHLVNLSWSGFSAGRLTGFAYLLDFEQAVQLSSNTFGARFNGSIPVMDGELSLGYELSAALQHSAGGNPADYTAGYYRGMFHAGKTGTGRLGASVEILGSDRGATAFQTPLATLHAFQGWADSFLAIPGIGVRDYSLFTDISLPWRSTVSGRYHWFDADHGSEYLGREINIQLDKQLLEQWSILVKFADFRGDGLLPNVRKYWVQMQFRF